MHQEYQQEVSQKKIPPCQAKARFFFALSSKSGVRFINTWIRRKSRSKQSYLYFLKWCLRDFVFQVGFWHSLLMVYSWHQDEMGRFEGNLLCLDPIPKYS